MSHPVAEIHANTRLSSSGVRLEAASTGGLTSPKLFAARGPAASHSQAITKVEFRFPCGLRENQ